MFAILLGLVLALTQTAFVPGSASSIANPPGCCGVAHCKMPCCARSSESPVSQPVVPARTVSPNHSQLVLAIFARLVILTPASSAEIPSSAHHLFVTSAAVPIYERLCSYLL